jgi:hypothetical protein
MKQALARNCRGFFHGDDAFNYRKKTMFDKSGQWTHLETFDEFDNGLSDLIDLWSSADKKITQALKESALAHFKEDLEAAALQWIENKAKGKKYLAIAQELAEFEAVLKDDTSVPAESDSKAPAATTSPKVTAKAKKTI